MAGEGTAGADGLELRRKEPSKGQNMQCLPGVRARSMESTGKPEIMETATAGAAQIALAVEPEVSVTMSCVT